MTKQQLLDSAEIMDAFRVVPRIILFGYSWFTVKVVWFVLEWYIALPVAERSIEVSGLTTGVITAVTGLATWAVKVYINSGRKWTGKEEVIE